MRNTLLSSRHTIHFAEPRSLSLSLSFWCDCKKKQLSGEEKQTRERERERECRINSSREIFLFARAPVFGKSILRSVLQIRIILQTLFLRRATGRNDAR